MVKQAVTSQSVEATVSVIKCRKAIPARYCRRFPPQALMPSFRWNVLQQRTSYILRVHVMPCTVVSWVWQTGSTPFCEPHDATKDYHSNDVSGSDPFILDIFWCNHGVVYRGVGSSKDDKAVEEALTSAKSSGPSVHAGRRTITLIPHPPMRIASIMSCRFSRQRQAHVVGTFNFLTKVALLWQGIGM